MPARRVALLSNRSVFAAGVQELLAGEEGIRLAVVGAGDPDVMAALRDLRPQVIVLDPEDGVIAQATVARALAAWPRARVVALSLSRRGIDVYRMERVVATDVAGFLKAIAGTQRGRKRASGRALRATAATRR